MDIFVYYVLAFIALLITFLAQAFISHSYSKYSKITNERNITGSEAARYILDKNGLSDIEVIEVSGYLTDHYDSQKKVIRLSHNVYSSSSISAVAVASHECGHAIQDKENYKFLRFRNMLVPIVNFSSYAGYLAIVFGIFFSTLNLIWIGISLEFVIFLFQLVTLPVEIDASKKALNQVDYAHLLNSRELGDAKTMLIAAALTYVASVVNAIVQILRLILIFSRRDEQ